MPVPTTKKKPYSIDDTLWGRAIECGVLEDTWNKPPADIWTMTANLEDCPAEPEEVVDAHAWDDFEIEGDAQELLEDMMISCLIYEVRIAAASAYAAENIMRQNATSESLKKLDEMESEATRVERKKKNQAAFRKTIDSFIKQKSLRR